MFRLVMSDIAVKTRLLEVIKRIDETYAQRPKNIIGARPLLVAVSKTKPAAMVIEAYKAGQRHFGENYVQELVEKSSHSDILEHCPDIKWHYIGLLQTNKINKILRVPNLYMIQTVSSERGAGALNTAWEKLNLSQNTPLRVLIQVNSSGEDVKGGVSPDKAPALYKYIREQLKSLQVDGIMTIGAYGFDYSTGPNPDFLALLNVQREICSANSIDPATVHLSMGMSNDYQNAIELGSTIVRVGSSIFGERAMKSD